MRRKLTIWLTSLALAGAVVLFPAALVASAGTVQRDRGERHPMIERALRALEAARDDLQDAKHDYCGHRAEALEATNDAIRQLHRALGSDRTSIDPSDAKPASIFVNASYTTSDADPAGRERHPKIRQAVNALERAKTDLQDAAHDFHGHRDEALESVNRALTQLHLALECDRD